MFSRLSDSCSYLDLVDGVSVRMLSLGKGNTPILFVPGWGMTLEIFERQYAHFRKSPKYQFVSFDPRGQGQSTKPMADYSSFQRAKDLRQIIDKLGRDKIVLGGWSQGVSDVLSYQEQFDDPRVVGLVLIDGCPKTAGDDREREWIWYLRNDADNKKREMSLVLLHSRVETARKFAESIVEERDARVVNWIAQMVLKMPPIVGVISNELSVYDDFEETLIAQGKKLPTFIVTSEKMGEVANHWISKFLPGTRFASMGAHMMFWERHDKFNSLLDDYLNSLDISDQSTNSGHLADDRI